MQELSRKGQCKLVFIIVAFCLSVVALAFILILFVLVLFFPYTYANFLKCVGLNNYALTIYQDEYITTKDVNKGYTCLMESIYAKNDNHIIFAYEQLCKDEKFVLLLDKVDEENIAKYGLSKNLLAFVNEYDYVSGKYVNALCNKNEKQKAFDFAFLNLNQKQEIDASSDKSLLIADYVLSCSDIADLKKVDDEVQIKMLTYSEKCEDYANSFVLKSEYNVYGFSSALECAIRDVEIYKCLDKLTKANLQTVITKEQIQSGKENANKIFSNVIKKAVN